MAKQPKLNFFRPHPRVQVDTGNELMTKQSHKDECDINNILKQYKRTGIITHVQNARPTYQDLSDSLVFQQSLNTIIEAEKAFAALPSVVRRHFDNDPENFLAAFADEKQHDKLKEFGLIRTLQPGDPLAEKSAPATQTPPDNSN